MADNRQYIMPENVARTIGKDAQRNNIMAARLVADILKTTLGPKGMDKMLVDSSGDIIVTNDGVTILENMELDHPAAKMIVEIAKTQEQEVGDGTTTVALLAGKLLERAEILLDKGIHPTIIVKGYKIAAAKALELIDEISIKLDNMETLRKIAMTAMTGKGAEGEKDKLADISVSALDIISSENDIDLSNIKIVKLKGGKVSDSELIQGIVLDKERANSTMPKSVKNAKILLLECPMELKTIEGESRISISTPEQLEHFIESEENYLRQLAKKVFDSQANVLFCQKGIDENVQNYLAKAGIFALRRVPREDMEMIARATSAEIVSSLSNINESQMGVAEFVEESKIGNEKAVFVKGCKNPKAVSIVIKSGSEHVADEVERAIKDALGVITSAFKNGKVVAGGGAVEIELSMRLKNFSKTLSGREQLAVEEFSNSLESIPISLSENAGLDPIDIITELKKKHELGMHNAGINLFNNKIEDCFSSGIIEPSKVKMQAISSASEVANLILRIDDVLISSEKKDIIKKESLYNEVD